MVVCKVHWEYIKSLYIFSRKYDSNDFNCYFKRKYGTVLSLFFVIAAFVFIAAYQWQDNGFIMEITPHLHEAEIYSVFTIF